MRQHSRLQAHPATSSAALAEALVGQAGRRAGQALGGARQCRGRHHQEFRTGVAVRPAGGQAGPVSRQRRGRQGKRHGPSQGAVRQAASGVARSPGSWASDHQAGWSGGRAGAIKDGQKADPGQERWWQSATAGAQRAFQWEALDRSSRRKWELVRSRGHSDQSKGQLSQEGAEGSNARARAAAQGSQTGHSRCSQSRAGHRLPRSQSAAISAKEQGARSAGRRVQRAPGGRASMAACAAR
ncbi:hypothetical protein CesoFtcFv8_019281 [Champsocephalus esox]|uniref:Uncharacterized protein n=1 Tax=Champsocephalus esox TaxID=159716 RepID=A0AAN8BJL6_9TELE|nr:hypothetical protein CesoFtcFv8_019281 [Champsocephalus esox]